jgi:hypothetical protein
MNETDREILKTTGTSLIGGAVGAGIYSAIGGMGLTAVGTAVGITLGPFIAIGAGLGGAVYRVFWLGKQFEKKQSQHPPAKL